MDHLTDRRNGKYTCLDCTKKCSSFCFECNNWHLFELDVEVSQMSYADKSEHYEQTKKLMEMRRNFEAAKKEVA